MDIYLHFGETNKQWKDVEIVLLLFVLHAQVCFFFNCALQKNYAQNSFHLYEMDWLNDLFNMYSYLAGQSGHWGGHIIQEFALLNLKMYKF